MALAISAFVLASLICSVYFQEETTLAICVFVCMQTLAPILLSTAVPCLQDQGFSVLHLNNIPQKMLETRSESETQMFKKKEENPATSLSCYLQISVAN